MNKTALALANFEATYEYYRSNVCPADGLGVMIGFYASDGKMNSDHDFHFGEETHTGLISFIYVPETEQVDVVLRIQVFSEEAVDATLSDDEVEAMKERANQLIPIYQRHFVQDEFKDIKFNIKVDTNNLIDII